MNRRSFLRALAVLPAAAVVGPAVAERTAMIDEAKVIRRLQSMVGLDFGRITAVARIDSYVIEAGPFEPPARKTGT